LSLLAAGFPVAVDIAQLQHKEKNSAEEIGQKKKSTTRIAFTSFRESRFKFPFN